MIKAVERNVLISHINLHPSGVGFPAGGTIGFAVISSLVFTTRNIECLQFLLALIELQVNIFKSMLMQSQIELEISKLIRFVKDHIKLIYSSFGASNI